ncbi:hypothetical protein Srubr_35920 [Streptomyces rubradiris]|uniref:Uncharacterized protein n=1 Tax=Streptomyces rubradiris TaxID=285531 RepID=A0ABQ3RD16_STRRR|nr:hypothetical protein GCM10018792_04840 [Streptomyces rubradiris]GHI53746.1 hypothetical protein Srubr_35920 [Streptomyces rubradiris]
MALGALSGAVAGFAAPAVAELVAAGVRPQAGPVVDRGRRRVRGSGLGRGGRPVPERLARPRRDRFPQEARAAFSRVTGATGAQEGRITRPRHRSLRHPNDDFYRVDTALVVPKVDAPT